MYEEFAGVYDTLMDDVDYAAWADYYLRLIDLAGTRPGTICDCGCGTGALGIEFARRGIAVTGVDLSEAMLGFAAGKARRAGVAIPFIRQDMCRLKLLKPVDCVVCACDGVNYLLSEARLNAFFLAAFAAIRPGGCLAFDFSTPHKLAHVLGDNLFFEERDAVAVYWRNAYDPARRVIEMDLTCYARRPGGLYERFEENQRQRAHTMEELARALARAGFVGVSAFGDKTLNAPEEDELRIHITARRP